MSKYAAIIKIGWITDCYEADDPCGIIRKAEDIQDFDCLLRMGRSEEDGEGQAELSKLEIFLDKYRNGTLDMTDIENLDVHLSIGSIVCQGTAEGDKQIEALKTQLDSKKR